MTVPGRDVSLDSAVIRDAAQTGSSCSVWRPRSARHRHRDRQPHRLATRIVDRASHHGDRAVVESRTAATTGSRVAHAHTRAGAVAAAAHAITAFDGNVLLDPSRLRRSSHGSPRPSRARS